jgi:hypothetical protein
LRKLDVVRLIDDLQTRIAALEQARKLTSADSQRLANQWDGCEPQHIEDRQDRWPLACHSGHGVVCRPEAGLEGAEVDPARVVADHDLAVDECVGRKCTSCSRELGEPLAKVACVSTQELRLACRPVPEQSTEAVKLGLISPLLA